MPDTVNPDFDFIVRSLQFRMQQQHKTVLVLGTRTSALFYSTELYPMLKPFSSTSIDNLKASTRFSELYHILAHPGTFSKAEINTMFIQALSTVRTSPADLCLAELVKRGLFDTIVTTNTDDKLEQALLQVGMQELQDFTVLNMASEVQSNMAHSILRNSKPGLCTIIKVFGELTTQNYIATDRYLYLSTNHTLTNLLREIVWRDCLVIGLDPVWDEELYRVFPKDGNALWFANEDKLDETSPLYRVCQSRNAKYVTGEPGGYAHFVTALHAALTKHESTLVNKPSPPVSSQDTTDSNMPTHTSSFPDLEQNTDSSSPAPHSSKPTISADTTDIATTTVEIFISYAPEDEQILNRLLSHIEPLQREKKIHVWYNRKIIPGQQQVEEIYSHLNSAKLILFLVSADFFASDYIHSTEVTQALKRQRAGEAHIIPIILRPVDWHNTPFGSLAPLPTDGKAVINWHNYDDALTDITRGIRNTIAHLSH